jgi:glycine hydroxymethyltransferase
MRYLTRFSETSSERIRSIIDMHWGIIRHWIHLIASASYPFPAVMKALSEPMCVFPIEGLPGERYFPGTAVMDEVENQAEELLRAMFAPGLEYRATIQPHSATQANQIVFNAVLGRGDVVLSLKPSDGGHVSHRVLNGGEERVKFYPLTPGGTIDYAALDGLARRVRPKLIIAGGSSYPREIDFAALGAIARGSGALLHADISHTATFVAAGIHAAVAPHADFISFNMVKNMRGPNGGALIYRSEHRRDVARGLFPKTQGGANENMMFAKLVTLEELRRIDLQEYARRLVAVARLMAATLEARGVPIVTGGTDSHVVLVDLRSSEMTGADAERACERYRVLANRNLVPNDIRRPDVASGVRLGSACVTILGYSDADIIRLAHWLADRFTGAQANDPEALVSELTSRYNEALLPLK